ncbi:hypothetical protein AJ88_38150 [Mesorhizobium amorphae CCBAU 01583]|nr:hypothetical protein AJ88_38150 [Mesorhizobium amorphae CCBAU 01583]
MVGMTDNRAQCDELRGNAALARTHKVGKQQFNHHAAPWLGDELGLVEYHQSDLMSMCAEATDMLRNFS